MISGLRVGTGEGGRKDRMRWDRIWRDLRPVLPLAWPQLAASCPPSSLTCCFLTLLAKQQLPENAALFL